jgi:hypothetical protein
MEVMAVTDEFERLRTSVDQFLHGGLEQPRTRVVDEAYRKRMHAALDDLLARLKQRRTCGGDREFSRRRL